MYIYMGGICYHAGIATAPPATPSSFIGVYAKPHAASAFALVLVSRQKARHIGFG